MATAKKTKAPVPTHLDEAGKKQALATAMSQIERDFGAGSIMKLGENRQMEVQAIHTGSLSLDFALGIGGVPRGRIVEVFGPESSGKTTVALHILAEVQKEGGTAAFIDAEHALDPVYAKALGQPTFAKGLKGVIANETGNERQADNRPADFRKGSQGSHCQ